MVNSPTEVEHSTVAVVSDDGAFAKLCSAASFELSAASSIDSNANSNTPISYGRSNGRHRCGKDFDVEKIENEIPTGLG
jgi:hypothetical protein